jgi:hypothetical protein
LAAPPLAVSFFAVVDFPPWNRATVVHIKNEKILSISSPKTGLIWSFDFCLYSTSC